MDKISGSIKETVGHVTGNHSMRAEGAAQKAGGHAQVETAKTQGYASGQMDSTGGAIKKNVGAALGNESMRAEGATTQAHGDIKKAANNY